jgi:hypothetical protein
MNEYTSEEAVPLHCLWDAFERELLNNNNEHKKNINGEWMLETIENAIITTN